MSERILAPLLVFIVLAGSTAAFGIEILGHGPVERAPSGVAALTLPKVEITGRRPATPVKIAERAGTADCGRDAALDAATHI